MIDPLFYIYIFSWAPSKFHSLSLFKVCDDAETKLTMTTERMTTMTMMTMFGSRCDALFRISPEAIHFCIPMYTRSIQKIDCFVALDANESNDNIQRLKRKQQQRRRQRRLQQRQQQQRQQ